MRELVMEKEPYLSFWFGSINDRIENYECGGHQGEGRRDTQGLPLVRCQHSPAVEVKQILQGRWKNRLGVNLGAHELQNMK